MFSFSLGKWSIVLILLLGTLAMDTSFDVTISGNVRLPGSVAFFELFNLLVSAVMIPATPGSFPTDPKLPPLVFTDVFGVVGELELFVPRLDLLYVPISLRRM